MSAAQQRKAKREVYEVLGLDPTVAGPPKAAVGVVIDHYLNDKVVIHKGELCVVQVSTLPLRCDAASAIGAAASDGVAPIPTASPQDVEDEEAKIIEANIEAAEKTAEDMLKEKKKPNSRKRAKRASYPSTAGGSGSLHDEEDFLGLTGFQGRDAKEMVRGALHVWAP